jgi:hypothetical protein
MRPATRSRLDADGVVNSPWWTSVKDSLRNGLTAAAEGLADIAKGLFDQAWTAAMPPSAGLVDSIAARLVKTALWSWVKRVT